MKQNKKVKVLLIFIIILINLFCVSVKLNANELIGMMNVYKITVNLKNIDTDEYKIELMDGILNRIYETQEGNEEGEHHFAIATDMDERHLVNYWVKIKFKNGEIKEFPPLKIENLIDTDDDKTDSSYSYEYNLRVRLFPKVVRIGFIVVCIIAILVAFIIWLKKRKRWIK